MNLLARIAGKPRQAIAGLLLLGALVLGLGIQQPTGLTGKDEYLLGLRIPMEMMQRDAWWVPYVDAAPRLKKPPFMYWLGRASFETFGPSLAAARGLTTAFALLLLGCAMWLGRHLTGRWQTGLLAAAVLLGISGMASESRRLMLDVPVAALSAAAFCAYLAWLDRPGKARLLATAAFLTLALMTKGPIALVLFGAGVAALWRVRPALSPTLRTQLKPLALMLALAAVLPVAWYLHVRLSFPAEFIAAGKDELEARPFQPSLNPLIGIVTLALPYSFIALAAWFKGRKTETVRLLGVWLLITLLPFFLFRSFERYLIGSLLPLSLLAALAIEQGQVPAWARRLGSLVPALLATLLGILLWRFELGGWLWLVPVLAWFLWAWWKPALSPLPLLLSAMLLWAVGWGIAFPRLGVNAVAREVVELTRGRQVILFEGPQPALLPILVKSPLRQTSQLRREDLKPGTQIALRLIDNGRLQAQLQALGVQCAGSGGGCHARLLGFRHPLCPRTGHLGRLAPGLGRTVAGRPQDPDRDFPGHVGMPMRMLPLIVFLGAAALVLFRIPHLPEPRFVVTEVDEVTVGTNLAPSPAASVPASPPTAPTHVPASAPTHVPTAAPQMTLLPAAGDSAHSVSLAALADGSLAAAWFAGSREGAADVAIQFSRFDGQQWSAPQVIAERALVRRDTGRLIRKLGNPVLWQDARGQLHCWFVSVSYGGWAGSSINHMVSTDQGNHWGRIERRVTSPFLNLSTLVRNPPLPLADGGLALPVYHEFLAKRAEWLRLDAAGRLADRVRLPGGQRLLQPAAVALDEHSALTLLRDASGAQRIHAARSEDGGQHWGLPTATDLPNPGAAVALIRLADGRLLLAYNPVTGNRNQLGLATSHDAGRTWSPPLLIEQDGNPDAEFSYPALAQTANGEIHLAYTWQRQRIKHLRFSPAWLTQARP
jgi:predicted neuraminidase/4-amino-4-deoxy-L-arabinose transferase-like glycosyltransferase